MSLFLSIENSPNESCDSRYLKDCPKSQVLVVIHEGVPLILQHIGSDLDYLDDVGMLSEYLEPECESISSGVYIWEGNMRVETISPNYYGEIDADEWLEGKLRPVTKEEWQAHLNDEWVWDLKLWYTPEALKEQGWTE